jgi:hypothetical protein
VADAPARVRALWRPRAQTLFALPGFKIPNLQNLNCTQKPMTRTIVEYSILYTIDPNRATIELD